MKLTIVDSSGREREVEIGSEPTLFGRGEDSDVVLGSRSVSRHHLKIWLEDGTVMVEDLTDGSGLELDGESMSGVFELEPGSEMEAGVFTFSIAGTLEDSFADEFGTEEEVAVPLLVGLKGPTAGLEIELQPGDNDVGLDAGMYLVIDDPSISRQHARLTVEKGRFMVYDMRSSNGTFVNRKRVDTSEIKSGDIVRFGNLIFRFEYGALISNEAQTARKKKMVLMGVVGVAGLAIIIGIGAKACGKKPPPGPVGPQIAQNNPMNNIPVDVRVERQLSVARRYMDQFDWKAALVEVDKAIDIFPICKECRNLKKSIEDEIEEKNKYQDALVEFELSHWEIALGLFKKIKQDSAYWKVARPKIGECTERLKTYHMREFKGYISATDWKNAHKHLRAYMLLAPCDNDVYERYVKTVEKSMRSSRFPTKYKAIPYVCARVTGPVVRLDPEEEIKKKYPRPKINHAVLRYYNGKIESAISELQKIKALERNAAMVEEARELDNLVRVVKGKYNQGITDLMRGRYKQARTQFEVALKTDKKFIPDGLTSFYREDIGKQLAEHLNRDGKELFARNKFFEAFAKWSDCLQFSPDDPKCQSGMMKLEKVAQDAIGMAQRFMDQGRKGKASAVLDDVKRITRPESLPYKEAVLRKQKMEME